MSLLWGARPASPGGPPPHPGGSRVLGLGVRSPGLGLTPCMTLGEPLALSESQAAASGAWSFGKADAPWLCRGAGGEGGETQLV